MLELTANSIHFGLSSMIGAPPFTPSAGENQLKLIKETFDKAAVLASGTPPEAWDTLGIGGVDAEPNKGIDTDGRNIIYWQPTNAGYFEVSGTPTAGDKIFGHMITNPDGSALVAIEKYDEPVDLVGDDQVHFVDVMKSPIVFADE